jgi:hypothetical protein
MPNLMIYSMPEGAKCPPKPEDDLGAQVKIGDPWKYGETGSPTIHMVTVPDNSDVIIYAKNSLKPGKCTWTPTSGAMYTHRVGNTTSTFCVPCRCIEAGALVTPLSGMYAAKRKDQSTTFPVSMRFQVNSQYCLLCDISAPGAIDQARAFLHTKAESGNHGVRHPGDFMNNNAPLTEGFLQGTFVGPRGENGALRMVLALIPTAAGTFNIHFGGFLSFGQGNDIETVFTSEQQVNWPGISIPA